MPATDTGGSMGAINLVDGAKLAIGLPRLLGACRAELQLPVHST